MYIYQLGLGLELEHEVGLLYGMEAKQHTVVMHNVLYIGHTFMLSINEDSVL